MTAVETLGHQRRAALGSAALTYREVGASLAELPVGYGHLDRARLVGHGRGEFDRAAERVLAWRLQLGAGLRVRTDRDEIAVGTLVDLGLGLGPLRLWSPCRVVAVVAEPDRRGFAYGTLPGHPESGEEAFLVGIDEHEQVWLRIRAFDRPGPAWVRALRPAATAMQQRIVSRYLDALTPAR